MTDSSIPHDPAAEEALVGAALLARTVVTAASPHVRATDFHSPTLGALWEAMVKMTAAGEPVNPATVHTRLNGEGPEIEELYKLTYEAPPTGDATVTLIAKRVAETAYARQVWHRATEVALAAAEGDLNAVSARLGTLNDLGSGPSSGLLRLLTMPELMATAETFTWLVKGLWADSSYGALAGEMKTLKSYVASCIAVGVASGRPVFGRFHVPAPRPVVFFVGEGGRIPCLRRLRRIAAAMGVELGDLPLYVTFDTAAAASEKFTRSLAQFLELEPGLVIVDPWYSYHGSATAGARLYEEGELLNRLSGPCMKAGSACLVANHFNQTGTGGGLKRITMAGMGEWADSWILVSHRPNLAPDVAAGEFHLGLEVGSRQWGGSKWDLEMSLGRFDEETGTHDGPISWRIDGAQAEAPMVTAKVIEAISALERLLTARPWQLIKSEIEAMKLAGRNDLRAAWELLERDERLQCRNGYRVEGKRTVRRDVWGIVEKEEEPYEAEAPDLEAF